MSRQHKPKHRKPRRPAGEPRNSAKITTGQGAKPYDEETLRLLAGIVPGVEIVHPIGAAEEFDADRLSRARAMAGYHARPFGAVVRVEALCTRYFQELVLGSAHELHIMHSKIRHVEAQAHCPFGTAIVVFKPGHSDRIENGLCPIYWERAGR
jgi:hypothetical protein